MQVLDQLHSRDDTNKRLQDDLDRRQRQFGAARHQMGILYEESEEERRKAKEDSKLARKAREEAEEKREGLEAKVKEYEGALKAVEGGEGNKQVRELGMVRLDLSIMKVLHR